MVAAGVAQSFHEAGGGSADGAGDRFRAHCDYCAMSAEDAVKALHSSKSGLSESEASERLKKHGKNRLVEARKSSVLSLLVSQFTSPLVLLLICASAISGLIGHGVDAAVILVIVVINAFFGFYQEFKAEKSMDALKMLSAPQAIVLRGGEARKISAEDLVPGDVIILEEGSKVPADARVVESSDLSVDESELTGESVPVSKHSVQLRENLSLPEMKNTLFMGTSVVRGRGTAVVCSTGMSTEIGRITSDVTRLGEEETPMQAHLKDLGKTLGKITLLICLFVFLAGVLGGEDRTVMFLTAVSLAVAAIPEGLPAVVTLSLALGVRMMAGKNALVRKLAAVEGLGSVDVICTDKTGTLTEDRMTVKMLYSRGSRLSVTGEGYDLSGDFMLGGKKSGAKGFEDSMLTGMLANNASIREEGGRDGKGKVSAVGDPTEVALLIMARKAGFRADASAEESRKACTGWVRLKELAFSSERRMMSVVCERGCGTKSGKEADVERRVFSKGSPERILSYCSSILDDRGRVRLMTGKDREKILSENDYFSSQALRVIALAGKEIGEKEWLKASSHWKESGKVPEKDAMKIEGGLTFYGLAGMMDPPRKEVFSALRECSMAGIRVVMITGDQKLTAARIARDLGMGSRVVEGRELEGVSDEDLRKIVELTDVFARTMPDQKMRIVAALKSNGHIVAVTGDGVNDAPALKMADIGVSMGIRGTDVAREASDMVLVDDNFATIVAAVREGRAIYDNVRKFVSFLLSCNIGEVMIIAFAMLFAIFSGSKAFLPLSAIQLLWINLLTDGLPALALGVDPPGRGVMSRQPRNPEEKMITPKIMKFMASIGLIMTALCVFLLYMMTGGIGAAASASAGAARTVVFTAIVFFEVIVLWAIRRNYGQSTFSNKYLNLSVLLSLAMQVALIYGPAADLFGVVPLSLYEWGLIFSGLAASAVLVQAVTKF